MRRTSQFSIFLTAFGVSLRVSLGMSAAPERWETTAKWHRTLRKAEPGTLLLDSNGVEFRSAKFNGRWRYVDIHTFDLSRKDLTLLTYENRRWHEPGERPFRFTLNEPMPPEIAAQFSERVGKPVRNREPTPSSVAIDEIPAHRRAWLGGSSGVLRLKDDGIDYITEAEKGRDARNWRWADIQTLANPNPYELRVTAFREIVEFDLKKPLSRDLFERMWDRLYANGLNLSPDHGDAHQEIHP